MSVYMQGSVPQHNRTWVNFQVEFACGQHKGDDVPLCLRPHINAETVGFSTLQDGRWGKEEKHMNPFQKGEQFEVIFIVHDFGYQVLVNRKTLCNYRHRIPPQNIRVISIDGDLELQSLSMMGGPVLTLPYNQPVSGGFHPGMAIYVEGTVPKNAEGFRVDFACGKSDEADILFHFNPRFGQGRVVLNTYQSGRWGNEQHHQMPFQKGKHFEAIFIVNEAEYQVLVNGNRLCSYKHRITPQFLKFINFFGNLQLQSLTMVGRQIEGNMTVPYTGNIPGGLRTNRTITVRGFIPENATRFEISLMAGKNIALHLNSHMKPQRYVVRNYYLNGKWGAEKNDLPFNPFQFRQYFEISICCDRRKFKVYTSGRHLFNFVPPYGIIRLIRTLEIKGDVILSYIKY
uniref:Galectin n=1 Tax=Naja naja TaxID=35670 RepID=A0A8C6Y4Q3_NAJNA